MARDDALANTGRGIVDLEGTRDLNRRSADSQLSFT
jgi:hypothetical protein